MTEDNRDSNIGYDRVVKCRVGPKTDECYWGMGNMFFFVVAGGREGASLNEPLAYHMHSWNTKNTLILTTYYEIILKITLFNHQRNKTEYTFPIKKSYFR